MTFCPFCVLDTGGQHSINCPTFNIPISVSSSWICVRCKKVNAPHVDQCNCVEPVGIQPIYTYITDQSSSYAVLTKS